MIIGIDLDSTAWKYPYFFAEIIKGLKGLGHEVYIVTGHINLREADLDLWGKRGFPEVDDYISKVEGEQGVPTPAWKVKKCKEYNVDYLIDDFDTHQIIQIVGLKEDKQNILGRI